LRWYLPIYVLYLGAVCAAVVLARPQYAVVMACVALAFASLRLPRWRRTAFAIFLLVPLLLLFGVTQIVAPLRFVPPVVLNVALATLFATTLRPGREPLISTFARMERGTLTLDLAGYTRHLTQVWVAFFIVAALVCALLAFAAPEVVWTWFVTVGNQIAVAILFLGEFWYRRLRFPQYRHASPIALAGIVWAHWRHAIIKM
jgi:uncharacterized membrane protein